MLEKNYEQQMMRKQPIGFDDGLESEIIEWFVGRESVLDAWSE